MGRAQKLSVVMPVYDERDLLRPALERLLKTHLPIPVEIIVVDDGSTDGGADTIADLVAGGQALLVSHPVNRGKGAALETGLDVATGELFTILDADLEYDPADLGALLAPILDGDAEVVYGTRSFGSHTAYSFWYVLGNRLIAFWASLLFNTWLSDVETCFKLAPTELWRSLGLRSAGFGVEAEATARFLAGGARVYEVPIAYKARRRDEGKKLGWRDGVAALWILLRVRLSPRRRRPA